MANTISLILDIAFTTLWRRRMSLIAFAIGASLFQYILIASYPAIGGAAAVSSVIQTLPPGLRRLLKIAPNLQAAFNLRDYIALGFFHPVFLGLGAAFVVARAADALAGEIERGSIYLILSRPVQRWIFVSGKLLEMLGGIGVIALLSWFGLAVGVWTTALPQPVPLARYFLIAMDAWALFAALGAGVFIISSLGNRTARVAGFGTAWTLITFVLDMLPVTSEPPFAFFNPWHHYDPPGIVATGTIGATGLTALISWIIVAAGLSITIFARRDVA